MTSRRTLRMKRLALIWLAAGSLATAQAQFFGPNSIGGAFWGSIIGGIAGGDCHNGFSGEGAAIGAGVGLLTGAFVDAAQRRNYYSYGSYDSAYVPAPSVTFGYGYGNCGSSVYVYTSPNNYCAPNYYYSPTRPNYAVNGTFLGAASGALIGAGSHDAGKGAAIGAATGFVVGSAAEISARHRNTRNTTTTPAQVVEPAASAVTVAHPPITSRPSPTSTYHWTTRPQPQIADATRVPDAPGF